MQPSFLNLRQKLHIKKMDGSTTYTNNVTVRKYTYSNYLKITFGNFIASGLGSVNILFGGRGATALVVIGSGSYADFSIEKISSNIADYYIPNVYIKNRTENHPIYIGVGGGLKANAMIMTQSVNIVSIEEVDTVPSDYTAY